MLYIPFLIPNVYSKNEYDIKICWQWGDIHENSGTDEKPNTVKIS